MLCSPLLADALLLRHAVGFFVQGLLGGLRRNWRDFTPSTMWLHVRPGRVHARPGSAVDQGEPHPHPFSEHLGRKHKKENTKKCTLHKRCPTIQGPKVVKIRSCFRPKAMAFVFAVIHPTSTPLHFLVYDSNVWLCSRRAGNRKTARASTPLVGALVCWQSHFA